MKLPLVTRSTVENFDGEEVDVVMICASLSVGRTVLLPVLRLSRPAMQQVVSGSFLWGQLLRRRFYARIPGHGPPKPPREANIGFFDSWMKAWAANSAENAAFRPHPALRQGKPIVNMVQCRIVLVHQPATVQPSPISTRLERSS